MITGKCCFACVREARGHVHDIDDVNGFDLWINPGIVRPDEPHHRSDQYTILLTSVIGSAVVPTLIAQLWFQRPCGAQRSPGHPLASLDWRCGYLARRTPPVFMCGREEAYPACYPACGSGSSGAERPREEVAAMPLEEIEIRPILADERAEWEPLWNHRISIEGRRPVRFGAGRLRG